MNVNFLDLGVSYAYFRTQIKFSYVLHNPLIHVTLQEL